MKEAGDFYGQIPKIVILPVTGGLHFTGKFQKAALCPSPKFCNLKMN